MQINSPLNPNLHNKNGWISPTVLDIIVLIKLLSNRRLLRGTDLLCRKKHLLQEQPYQQINKMIILFGIGDSDFNRIYCLVVLTDTTIKPRFQENQ
jgi:hypothetical protein